MHRKDAKQFINKFLIILLPIVIIGCGKTPMEECIEWEKNMHTKKLKPYIENYSKLSQKKQTKLNRTLDAIHIRSQDSCMGWRRLCNDGKPNTLCIFFENND